MIREVMLPISSSVRSRPRTTIVSALVVEIAEA
jgi:hypothetical protein